MYISPYLGLLHCLSRYVTPLWQLLEHVVQDDHSDQWPCWGLGPSSPCFTHWPLRHHWRWRAREIMSGREKGSGREEHTRELKSDCQKLRPDMVMIMLPFKHHPFCGNYYFLKLCSFTDIIWGEQSEHKLFTPQRGGSFGFTITSSDTTGSFTHVALHPLNFAKCVHEANRQGARAI